MWRFLLHLFRSLLNTAMEDAHVLETPFHSFACFCFLFHAADSSTRGGNQAGTRVRTWNGELNQEVEGC